MTRRSRSGSAENAWPMSSRRSETEARSKGDSATSSSTRSPSFASPPFPERILERERKLRHPQDLPHLLARQRELGRDLLRSWLARQLLDELALDAHDLAQPLDHVHGHADRPCLVGDRARHRLPDPPGCVGRELEAAAIVEFLDRANQPQRAFLDQVEEGE